ncbi:basic salivary proline-rich protein 1-like [Paramacrobiotus metropolitanus]|uniref:basic salivary proline-rich protein 1-like n=1 Tax=Paramacrobiotus metropolitanus TaxID=2943436 RepID=UPI002445DB21|nr:basic salivary proline-rich protein 1-like [Paramacrobiotus metropolitanus]
MRPHSASAMQQTRKAPLIVKIQRSARSHTALPASLPAAPPAPRFLASQAAGPELHMADLEAGLPDALPLHRDATMNEQSAPGTPSGYQSPELGMPPHGPYIHYSPESPPPTHPTSPSPSGMRAASTSPVAPAKRPAGHPSPQRRSPRGRPASARAH